MRSGTVFIVKNQISVDIPETDPEYMQGLGGRAVLGKDSGMLFRYQGGAPTMNMKGMMFPLDFIYITNNKVSGTREGVWPNSLMIYSPVPFVDYVLEVNAGYVQSHGIYQGDAVSFA